MGEQPSESEYPRETPYDDTSEHSLDIATTTRPELEGQPVKSDDLDSIINCIEQFNYPASAIQNLHLQVAVKPIPEGKTDYEGILEQVAVWNTSEVTRRIMCSLQRHFKATDAQVTRFRASLIFSLTNDDCAYPVVEWRQEDDTEVIAIFYLDEIVSSDVCD